MANLSSSLEHLMKQIGKECIYKEGGLIMHAQLSAVNINADMLELKFRKIPSHGFTEREANEFSCSGIKEYINFSTNRIYISLVNIEIFFKKEQINGIKKLMKNKPNIKSLTDLIRVYRQHKSTKLNSFEQNQMEQS
ncbi:hypothetical protein RAE19_01295 [Rhodoferax sp. TBRC 17660]|uniref:Uncharacterized protein n=1 Tax=Rhodoferax potami TaxID=3068338 RepID=A0ABU3KHZ3_9BURK|nr:hypothetical protein [Rhodoferax sp. TBRC 17660]MDT7517389.1 hypothetical protein [Rhodoferax sp. TBRC 17660]